MIEVQRIMKNRNEVKMEKWNIGKYKWRKWNFTYTEVKKTEINILLNKGTDWSKKNNEE